MSDDELTIGRMISVEDLRRFLRVSKSTAYSLVKDREVESVRIGGTIRIPASSALAYIARSYTPQACDKDTPDEPTPRPTRTVVTDSGTVFENIA